MLTTTLPPKHENEIMTIADALRYEGSQQGFQKGRQEGALESAQIILTDLLKVRFNKKASQQFNRLLKVPIYGIIRKPVAGYKPCHILLATS